jgi:hypothetical protein
MSQVEKERPLIKSYFENINRFGCNEDFLEIKSAEGKQNYYLLLHALINHGDSYHQHNNKVGPYLQVEGILLDRIVLDIMSDILGDEYKHQIRDFQQITKNVQSNRDFEGDFCYDCNEDYTKTIPIEFQISNLGTPLSLVACSHEYTHGLISPRQGYEFNDYFGNIHNYEFPSVMMERIFAIKLGELLKEDIIGKVTTIRQSDSAEHALWMSLTARMDNDPESQMVSAFIQHETYSYILADVYSTYLKELYLEDPLHFLKLYRKLIKGELNIPDYFKEYGLGFSDNITRHYLKELKR